MRVRVATLLVVLSVLFAFGMRLSHMLLVQHVICEHGHLVDEHKTATTDKKHRASVPTDRVEDQDTGNLDEHDHCDVMSVLHRSDGVSIISSVMMLSWLDPIGIQEARETLPIDVIALAPKSSPPTI